MSVPAEASSATHLPLSLQLGRLRGVQPPPLGPREPSPELLETGRPLPPRAGPSAACLGPPPSEPMQSRSRQTRAPSTVRSARLFTALPESADRGMELGHSGCRVVRQLSQVFPTLGTPPPNRGSHWKTCRQGTPSSGHTEDVPRFDFFLFSNPCCRGELLILYSFNSYRSRVWMSR